MTLYTIYDPANPSDFISRLNLAGAMDCCMTANGGEYVICARGGGGWVLWIKKPSAASWELTDIHSLTRGKWEARAEIFALAEKFDWPLECISDQGFASMLAAKAAVEAKMKEPA